MERMRNDRKDVIKILEIILGLLIIAMVILLFISWDQIKWFIVFGGLIVLFFIFGFPREREPDMVVEVRHR
jgi:hypothetical protein